MSATVIDLSPRTEPYRGLRFTPLERDVIQAFGCVPGYAVAFECGDLGDERVTISATGGDFTLLDLVRIECAAEGHMVVDGSKRQPRSYSHIEEAVIAAWLVAFERMAAFGLR